MDDLLTNADFLRIALAAAAEFGLPSDCVYVDTRHGSPEIVDYPVVSFTLGNCEQSMGFRDYMYENVVSTMCREMVKDLLSHFVRTGGAL